MNATKKAKFILEKKKIITWWELAGIFLLFSLILYILFPKGKLERYIIAETKNYDLAIRYLETLISSYPDLEEFQISLLKFYIKKGYLKKAVNLIERMNKKKYRENISFNKTAYNLYIDLYSETKNEYYLNKAKSYLENLLNISNSTKVYEFVYKESLKFNFPHIRFRVLKLLVKAKLSQDTLKELFNLSIYFKDYKTAIWTIDKLYQINKSIKWLEKKADIYLYVKKDINKAVSIYIKLLNMTKNKKLQTKYFLKALFILKWNKKYKQALYLSRKYENFFLYTKNKTVLKRIIKFYLETGNLKDARRLSLKILKVENIS